MAVLGVMTTEFDVDAYGSTSLAETAQLVARHGLGAVQLQLGSVFREVATTDALLHGLDVLGDRLSAPAAVQARETLAAHGVTVSAVDGTYNMAHPDPVRRDRNLRHLLALIDLAPDFGTDLVTLCTGSRADVMWHPHPGNRSPQAWHDLLDQISVAVAAAESAGVRLAFEPEHNNVVDSARASRQLLDEIRSPALRVLMDPANLFHHGDLDRMPDLLAEAFDLVGAEIALAHAKDLDRDGDAGHRAAGCGRLDYDRYLAELHRHGFDGAVVLHQLAELAPDRVDTAFRYVRDHAPDGYLAPGVDRAAGQAGEPPART